MTTTLLPSFRRQPEPVLEVYKMRMQALVAKLLLVSVLMFSVSVVSAEEEAKQPDGTVKVSSKSIAIGIGVSWGHGLLTVEEKDYPFDLSGLSVIDLGVSGVTAAGEVYNLTNVEDFPGKYVAAKAGFTLAGGVGGVTAKNDKGVVIHLRSTSEGVSLSLAAAGFTVKWEE